MSSTGALRVYMLLVGVPVKGHGEAARYVSGAYRSAFRDVLGCDPYPGTLNVRVDPNLVRALLELEPCRYVEPRGYWRVGVYEALVYGMIPALLVAPYGSPNLREGIVELVACKRLWEICMRLGKVFIVVGCGLLNRLGVYLERLKEALTTLKQRTIGSM